MLTSRGLNRAGALLAVLTAGALSISACTSKELDPRCTLVAPYEYQDRIAQFINGSGLWQAYLDYLSPVKEGASPVVEISLTLEREITRETSVGDYDPGIVYANLEMTNLVSGQTLASNNDRFAIKGFVVGDLAGASREEIQEAAFAATEKGAMRSILYSMEMGVILGMRDEGSSGTSFIPALEEKAADPTAGDMAGAARGAIDVIRGS